MSEYIQALELRISDNAQQAVGGLDKLAASLRSLRSSISKGLNLQAAATEIRGFSDGLQKVSAPDNVARLTKLADALMKVANASKAFSAARANIGKLEQQLGIATAATTTAQDGEYVRQPRSARLYGRHSHNYAAYQTAQERAAQMAPSGREFGMETAASTVQQTTEEIKAAVGATEQLKEATKTVKVNVADIKFEFEQAKERVALTREEVIKLRNERPARTAGNGNGRLGAYETLKRMGDPAARAAEAVPTHVNAAGVRASEALGQMTQKAPEVQTMAQQFEQMGVSMTQLGDSFARSNSQLTIMKANIAEMKNRLGQAIANGDPAKSVNALALQIKRAEGQVAKLEAAQEKASDAAKEHKSALDRMKGAISGALGPIRNLVHSMGRLAKMRILRYMLRQIAEGFSTGLENVRAYSKAINGLYYKDMQGLDNNLLMMKNSLGAVAAQVAQSLIPVFQTLAQWVINVSNAINQFVALLSGKTSWTKAVYTEADAIEEAGNAASGASKKMKGLLADWDELNIIQSESGGGGSGSKKKDETDYTKMFEESYQFDGWIRDTIEWLEEHTAVVYGAIAGIAGLLLGMNGKAILVTLGLVTSFSAGYEDGASGQGFLSDLESSLIGAAELAAAGALIGWSAGGAHGALIGLTIGAIASLGLNFLGWAAGNYVAEEGDSFLADCLDDVANMVPTVLAATVLGASFGGFKGALIGLTIGTALTLGANYIDWSNEKASVNGGQIGFLNAVSATAIASLGIAGAILGLKYGGVAGGWIGGVIGLTLGIAIRAITFAEETKKAKIASLWGDQDLTPEQLHEQVKDLFKYDVDVVVDVKNARTQGMLARRKELQGQIENIMGRFTAMVNIGLTAASSADVSALKSEVEGVVTKLNAQLDDVKVLVGVMINEDTTYARENAVDLNAAIGDANTLQEYVTGLGNEIGGYLSDGIIDEVEAKTLPGLMQTLDNVTRAISEGQNVGKYVGKAKAAGEKAKASGYSKEAVEAFSKEYGEIVTNIQDAALQEAIEYQQNLFGLAYGLEAAGFKEEADAALARAENFPVQQHADEVAAKYMEGAAEQYRTFMQEAIFGAMGKWSSAGNEFHDVLNSRYRSRSGALFSTDASSMEYFLKDAYEMNNLLYEYVHSFTGIGWDSLQGYSDAGGNVADLLPDWIKGQIYNMFNNAGYGEEFRSMFDERVFGRGFRYLWDGSQQQAEHYGAGTIDDNVTFDVVNGGVVVNGPVQSTAPDETQETSDKNGPALLNQLRLANELLARIANNSGNSSVPAASATFGALIAASGSLYSRNAGP